MSKKALRALATTVVVFYSMFGVVASGSKGEIHTVVPETVDPNKEYLFYMHGAWIEIKGLNHAHPFHGPYEYDKIVKAFSEKGSVVISEARLRKVATDQYANEIARQVRHLLDRGVPPENITIIGHSKGGLMTLIVASILEDAKINYVVMAGCGRKGTRFRRGYDRFLEKRVSRMRGRILSIYDAGDRVSGTCQEAFDRATRSTAKEIVLRTHRGHGLFYSPESIWIDEVVKWSGGFATPKAIRQF